MPTKTEAIKLFLQHEARPDLAARYSFNMECQVNVSQDGGERIIGEYRGRQWSGWTDGLIVWKALRIPWNANANAHYTDSEMKFDLPAHVEAIGMTGWDWKNRVSRWVAFDFDSILGHKDGLTPAEIQTVAEAAATVEWVTTRKSTSGKGLHLYVDLLTPVPTENHNEHAALARAILGQLAAITGCDFQNQVDTCGGNMWVWHRKMRGTDGLTVAKQGIPLTEPPINWKDHIVVTSGKKRRNQPSFVTDEEDLFDELCGQHPRIPLDEIHRKLIDFLTEIEALWWWDADRHMLVAHTFDLKRAHDEFNFKGLFDTRATGQDRGSDQNCFAFPIRRGAWAIRRHTKGVQEHQTWEQDGQGWTRTYLNRDPDFRAACRAYNGIETTNGAFVFREAEVASRAASALGAHLNVPARFQARETTLKQHKDGRLICEIKHESSDDTTEMQDWLLQKNKPWVKIQSITASSVAEPDTVNYDDLVRHLTTEAGDDYGWLIKSDIIWRNEPLVHVKLALEAMGHAAKDVKSITGTAILRCWTMVNRPFQPEYPGDRTWNRNAAQFRFAPSLDKDPENLKYPYWEKVLSHCGTGLNDAVQENGWCRANGIISGTDYLKCWIASLFQEPLEPLPYLFLYGPQNSGKSILHEALDLLVTKGCHRADHAIMNQSGFNGELENAVICIIEETDVNRNRTAYNKIKDWVTSRSLSIRKLYHTPYHVPNSTHWIQCANDHNACPIFPGDTRITMVFVPAIEPTELIPKKVLIPLLEKEAPDFLAAVLSLEIPKSNDRLNVPVIETAEKTATASLNLTDLQRFIQEQCFVISGESIKMSDFYVEFTNWIDPNEVSNWTKIKLGRELPPEHPRGRASWDNGQFYIGNISFNNIKASKSRLVLRDEMLRHL